MKNNKKKPSTTDLKELIMKCILVVAAIFIVSGIIGGIVFLVKNKDILGLTFLLGGFAIAGVCIGIIFIIGNTVKEEGVKNKDYKIKKYICTLNEEIKDRMKVLYERVLYSQNIPDNFYSTYHKKNEVVIIAVMYVDSFFSEDEFIAFMNEISEVNEKILNHTLIVVFIEKEKSVYLKKIMSAPEYNSLWDTKIFCVYEPDKRVLNVNKTNSGTGNKAFNNAIKILDYIFSFQKDEQKSGEPVS